ncbi:MAG: maleylpyruvate isomerase family mycothiol-dependent enzyme, partial [Acidimicrobiales bacterium]
MPAISELCADLAAEQHSLDSVVAGLAPEGWATPTPAAGWDLGDSISHLCYFDETAALAIDDPAAFEAHKSALLQALGAGGTTPDVALGRAVTGAALLERWRASRARFLAVAVAAGASPRPARVPWYGPPMSVASFVSARIMETWAHGADVRDALGVPLEATARLRHICHLGVAARAYSFIAHGQTDPGDPVTVEAHSP